MTSVIVEIVTWKKHENIHSNFNLLLLVTIPANWVVHPFILSRDIHLGVLIGFGHGSEFGENQRMDDSIDHRSLVVFI